MCWIPSPGLPCSKPVGGSKVDSAFHSSKVDKMSTRNFRGLSGKKQTASSKWLWPWGSWTPFIKRGHNVFFFFYYLKEQFGSITFPRKTLLSLHNNFVIQIFFFFFSYLGFLSWTFTIHRTAGEGRAISLTHLFHFHLLHRQHLGIS